MKLITIIKKPRLLLNRHFWWDLKYNIKCFFNPKQKWLTDVIPKTFCDKVELIPCLLFKCLEHYVEVERKQGYIHDLGYDWAEELKEGRVSQDYVDSVTSVDKELLDAYNWIKIGRVELEKRIDDAFPPMEHLDDIFKKSKTEEGYYEIHISEERKAAYKEVTRLENIKVDGDNECMHTIIKHRIKLWT